eukprot:2415312-Rhodomonas_salina.1
METRKWEAYFSLERTPLLALAERLGSSRQGHGETPGRKLLPPLNQSRLARRHRSQRGGQEGFLPLAH